MTSNIRVAGMRPHRARAQPGGRAPHAVGRIIGSVARAASILAAARPAEALAINEATYAAGRAEGGFPIAATPGASYLRAIAANDALFARAGATGTPATYYCTRASHTAMVMFGMPRDIPAFLAQADPSGIACGEHW